MSELELSIPAAAGILFQPSRYKVLHGGRGGGKSWAAARAILIRGYQAPIRVLCAREYQRSIDESVHQLLASQIAALGLGDHYCVGRSKISGVNGTEIFYGGLHHNVSGLKSYEGVDICWVEEAQAVTAESWRVLIPTIRKAGSEIWITFNPELERDEVYQRFVVAPPVGCLSAELLWSDNPWLTAELTAERLDCLHRDPAGYRNIWMGKCRASVQGAIYAGELEAAREAGRIGRVLVDRALPVHTAWDIGYLDPTAIWFYQATRGGEIRFIDYYEDIQEDVAYYIQIVRDKGYNYGRHVPPHDLKAHHFSHKQSAYDVARGLGFKFEEPLEATSVELGIHAVKMAFQRLYFDSEKCATGLQRLAHYRRAWNSSLQQFRDVPVHDLAAHGADSLRYAIVGLSRERGEQPRRAYVDKPREGGWMAR